MIIPITILGGNVAQLHSQSTRCQELAQLRGHRSRSQGLDLVTVFHLSRSSRLTRESLLPLVQKRETFSSDLKCQPYDV